MFASPFRSHLRCIKLLRRILYADTGLLRKKKIEESNNTTPCSNYSLSLDQRASSLSLKVRQMGYSTEDCSTADMSGKSRIRIVESFDPKAPSSILDPNTTTKLVIFDKDGTLADCDPMFGAYIVELYQTLLDAGLYKTPSSSSSEVREEVADLFFSGECMGYDRVTGKFLKDSPLLRQTHENNYRIMAEFQIQGYARFGFSRPCLDSELIPFIKKSLKDCKPKLVEENLAGCGDTHTVMSILHKQGIQSAICTMDERPTTEWMIQTLVGKQDFDKFVCGMACGTDGMNPKPHPEGILHLCETANVPVGESVMVGDSLCDLQAGMRAGCKAVIFVQSGGLDSSEVLDELDIWLNSSEESEQHGRENLKKTKVFVRRNINDILDML